MVFGCLKQEKDVLGYLNGCINNTTVMIPEKEYIADVNKDGVIDSNDLALISAYIAGEPVVLQ